MRKLIATFVLFPLLAEAAPARLQGFSYKTNPAGVIEEREDTAAFNEPPHQYEIEPLRPDYIDEDGNDIRYSVNGSDNRYKFAPVHSQQELYDIKNGKSEAKDDEVEETEFEEED